MDEPLTEFLEILWTRTIYTTRVDRTDGRLSSLVAQIIPGGAEWQLDPIAVATVLGSLYALATTAPAHRSGREPVSRVNIAGILLAGLGATLIAVSG